MSAYNFKAAVLITHTNLVANLSQQTCDRIVMTITLFFKLYHPCNKIVTTLCKDESVMLNTSCRDNMVVYKYQIVRYFPGRKLSRLSLNNRFHKIKFTIINGRF